MVLKLAAGVDEHVASQMNVLPAIGIKRRKQGEAVVNRPPRKLSHQHLQLLGSVIGVVYFHAHANGLLAHAVHKLMLRRAANHRFARIEMGEIILQFHR